MPRCQSSMRATPSHQPAPAAAAHGRPAPASAPQGASPAMPIESA
jgi:hypothetical protein